jgi:dienelactone hydrolase
LAPVTADYTPKGKYEKIAGINTCKMKPPSLSQVVRGNEMKGEDRNFLTNLCNTDIVGPEDATKGIVDIYDIFGIWPQTVQGADRLAAHTGFLVLIPDLFDGTGLDINAIPMDTPEKAQKVQDFVSTTGNPQANVEKLLVFRKALADRFPAVEGHWGLFGLCWGGKLAVLACGEGNEGVGRRFSASGTAHPG